MTITAKNVRLAKVVTVEPTLPLLELERLFEREQLSGVPVLEKGRLVGVVSRADVARALAEADDQAAALLDYYGEVAGASSTPVERARLTGEATELLRVTDVMSTRIVAVEPDQSIQDVAKTLVKHRVHRVLVAVDRQLIGVISSLDLVQLIADGRLAESRD
jgi:CBS domain-containing protein